MKKLIITGLVAAGPRFYLPAAMAQDYKSETDRTADRSASGRIREGFGHHGQSEIEAGPPSTWRR